MGLQPRRDGPDPHFHRTMSEAFYVLSGVVRLNDGTGWTDAHAGDYLYVPPGGVHGFRNDSGEAASMLLLFSPGAPREEYFERLATLAEDPMGDAERDEFVRRHGTYWL
ncbi:cupin domain-containing protein [Streptomyces sp. NPDC088910]|uniref:cupin domain-containing protein n=1 Tax=Streptomyces sp. NPDC088910 TaxID=3365911 RepID=UPI0037F883C4